LNDESGCKLVRWVNLVKFIKMSVYNQVGVG